MNYQALLKKYMQFLGEYEGSTFVHALDSHMSDVEFTDEEVRALEEIDNRLFG